MNYYEVLGIPETASAEEIRAAYRVQIKYFHPDVFPGNPDIAKRKTLQLNEAYEVLSNPDKRLQYDALLKGGHTASSAHHTRQESTAPPPPPPPPGGGKRSGASAPKGSGSSGWNPSSKAGKLLQKYAAPIVGFCVVLCVLGYLMTGELNRLNAEEPDHPDTSQPSESSFSPDDKLEPPVLPFPETGEILSETNLECVAPFTVKASDTQNFYVKLKDAYTLDDVMAFFVRAGETAELDVPLGLYWVYYATGDEWYGKGLLFGKDTSYSRAQELFDFYEEDGYVNGWTVELYLQPNGNLNTQSISPDQF